MSWFVRATFTMLAACLTVVPAAAQEVLRVVLTVAEPSGVQRTGSWVESGVPFAKGELKDAANARLVSSDGKELPLDAVPLSRHDDGSVKWLLVAFPLDLAPNAEAKCVLEHGPGVARKALLPNLKIEDGPDRVTIDAGVLRASWPKKAGRAGFGDVWADLDGDGKTDAQTEQVVNASDGPGLTASRIGVTKEGIWAETAYAADLAAGGAKVAVERAGEHCAVVRIDGWHADGGGRFCPYTQRWTVRAGSRSLTGTHTIVYSGIPELDFLGSASVGFVARLGDGVRAAAAIGGKESGADLKAGDRAFVWQGSPSESAWRSPAGLVRFAEPAQGWLRVEGPRGSVCVAVRDFRLRYPKELAVAATASGAQVTLYAYPEDLSAPLDFRRYADEIDPGDWGYETSPDAVNRSGQGAAFSHDLYVGFAGPGEMAETAGARARGFDRPLVARPGAEHVARSEALYPFGPSENGKFPRGETYLRTMLDTRLLSQTEFGWLGVLDYGDAPKGSAEGAWIMHGGHGWWTKTSPVPCCLVQFYRTGDRRYYDFAIAMARNTGDVATVHYADGKGTVWRNSPEDVGSVHRHGYQHWSGYAGSPQYTGGGAEGLVDAYLATGDGRFLDVALETAGFNLSRKGQWGFDYMLRVYCQLAEVHRAKDGGEKEAERFSDAARRAAAAMPKGFKDRWANMVAPAVGYASRVWGIEDAAARLAEYRNAGIEGLLAAVCRYRLRQDKAELDAIAKTYREIVAAVPAGTPPAKRYAEVVAAFGRNYPWPACDYLAHVQGVPAAMRLFEELGMSEKDILAGVEPGAPAAPSLDAPPAGPPGLLLSDDMECHRDAIHLGAHSAGATRTAGILGRGIRIDGEDRYWHFANPSFRPRGWRSGSAARFDAVAGSVAFWLKPDFAGGDGKRRVLFSERGAPGGEGLSIEVTEAGELALVVVGARGKRASAFAGAKDKLRPGAWTHVAGAWDLAGDPVELRLVVNGETVASRKLAGGERLSRSRAGVDLDLGSEGGRFQAPGVYDAWRVWDRVLDSFDDAKAKSDPEREDIHAAALLNDPLESAKESALHGGSAKGEFEPGWLGSAYRARGGASLTYPVGLGPTGSLSPATRFDPRRGSIEVFAKAAAGGGRRTLVSVDGTLWFGWEDGKLSVLLRSQDGKEHALRADAAPAPDRWQHFACSWDASAPRLCLFAGGRLAAKTQDGFAPPFAPNPPGGVVRVGSAEGKDPADAAIDQVKIWDAPKTRFLSAEGILFYASFDQATGNAADYAEGDPACLGLSDGAAAGRVRGGVRQWGLSQIRFLPFAHCEVSAQEPSVNIAPDAGTVCFWMKGSPWTVAGDRRNIFYAPLNGSSADKVQIAVQDKKLNVRLSGLKETNTPPLDLAADKWYHIAVSWDRREGAFAVYLDGAPLVNEKGLRKPKDLRSTVPYDSNFLLGGWFEHEAPCSHAAFDELVIFREPLPADAVKALYQRQSEGRTP